MPWFWIVQYVYTACIKFDSNYPLLWALSFLGGTLKCMMVCRISKKQKTKFKFTCSIFDYWSKDILHCKAADNRSSYQQTCNFFPTLLRACNHNKAFNTNSLWPHLSASLKLTTGRSKMMMQWFCWITLESCVGHNIHNQRPKNSCFGAYSI